MMASPRSSQRQPKIPIVITIFIFAFAVLPSKSVGRIMSSYTGMMNMNKKYYDQMMEMKSVLGSRPPSCTNRCMGCTPCDAVISVPPNTKPQEQDPYYLVTWKCRCNNKLFPP